QMVGYWRALLIVNCGGPDVHELPLTPSQKEAALEQARQLSLDASLAGLDIWTAVKGRMRDSSHAQVLLEMAVVRLARLDELLSVGTLVTALSQGEVVMGARNVGSARAGAAGIEAADSIKKNGPLMRGPGPSGEGSNDEEATQTLTESTIPEIWNRLNRYLSEKAPILASHLRVASLPAIFGPNSLAIRFSSEYNHAYEACDGEANLRRIEDALKQVTGMPIKVYFELVTSSAPGFPAPPPVAARVPQAADRKKQLMRLPLFRRAGEALGAQIWHVDEDFHPMAP